MGHPYDLEQRRSIENSGDVHHAAARVARLRAEVVISIRDNNHAAPNESSPGYIQSSASSGCSSGETCTYDDDIEAEFVIGGHERDRGFIFFPFVGDGAGRNFAI